MNNEKELREFLEGKFYINNLINGYKIEKEAIEVLLRDYKFCLEKLYKIKNYDEIGIVEIVANNRYTIIDNVIYDSDDIECEDCEK